MIERKEKVAVASEKGKAATMAIGKWIAALVAVGTPVCYLNGRAFHDGYLARLHLSPSMFPADAQSTFTDAALGWMNGAAVVLSAVSDALAAHWFLIIVLPTILITGLSAALHEAFHRLEAKRKASPENLEEKKPRRLLWTALTPVFTLFFGAYLMYTVMACIGALLMLSIGPFAQIGARVANDDLNKGFPNAPVIELVAPHGESATYRIIQCADKFCALYRDRQIITIPISAVTWATSNFTLVGPGERQSDHK